VYNMRRSVYSCELERAVGSSWRREILVELRNPDQLAEALLKILNNENLRQELSKKALEQAKKFSIEDRINKIEEKKGGAK